MAIPIDRLPPQSLEAEQSVLGSMLIEKDAILRATDILEPADFYRDAHRKVFEAIVRLADRGEAVDIITVTEELRRRGELEDIGGIGYISSLANMVPTAANVEHYARIVEEKAILRRLIEVASEVARRAYSGEEEVDEILDRAENMIFSVVQGRRVRGYVHIRDVLVDTYEHIGYLYAHKGAITGIPTGFTELDEMTSGMHPSELIIIAARPSQGKTALCLNIACHAAVRRKVPVAIFSLEMSKEQLAQRMLCAEAHVNGHRLRTGLLTDDDWSRLAKALSRLSEAPILIDDTPNIPLMELRAKARRMKAEHDIGLVIIDYLQLMQGRGRSESRQQEISEVSRSLKSLARELQVPVLALSQLSRAVEQRQDKRPLLSDLRESGSIEQDADLVAFIYHNPEEQESNVVELIVAKQRNGPTGSIQLVFLKDIGKFVNLEKRLQPA